GGCASPWVTPWACRRPGRRSHTAGPSDRGSEVRAQMLVDHVEDLFRDLGAVPVRMVRAGEPVVRVLDQLRPAELLAVHFRLEAGALVEPAAHSLVALAVDDVRVDRVEVGEVRLPGGEVGLRWQAGAFPDALAGFR